MKLVYSIITCDRPKYFEHNILTWIETINNDHDWWVHINDDSSVQDYTLKYVEILRKLGIRVSVIKTNRRGPHYLVNKSLQLFSKEEFDYGFMSEDDIYFIQKGWDDNYLRAIRLSSFEYLCYWNSTWAKKYHRGSCVCPIVKLSDLNIQSEVKLFNCFGCLWTFSPKIIRTVGYFDMVNFGVWGNAHTDYAKRCCRLRHNGINGNIFDVLDSNEYIQMEDNNYTPSGSNSSVDSSLIGVPDGKHKGLWLSNNKINYVPYNEIPLDMLGNKVT